MSKHAVGATLGDAREIFPNDRRALNVQVAGKIIAETFDKRPVHLWPLLNVYNERDALL
jgi:hypothetical protein